MSEIDYSVPSDASGGISVGVGSLAEGGSAYPVSPLIGTPAPSSIDSPSGGGGGIFSSLDASSLQGISNIGLQWFTAVTKGVSGKLQTPQPVQATPGAAAANVLNQTVSYLPWIIIIIAIVILAKVFTGRR